MSFWIACICLILFYTLGYRFWCRHLTRRIFQLSPNEKTPAHDPNLRDNIDYLPVSKHVLWGHHYTSVAGAAPIIGPAVAIIWGWLPALLWVVLGTIFMGAAHDFGALVLSARQQGHSISHMAADLINARVRLLFKLIIYFLIWIVLAVFAFAIGILFDRYPSTVIPINFEIIVALILGSLLHLKKINLWIPSLIALITLYLMIPVGLAYPISLTQYSWLIQGSPIVTWGIILLIYSAIASLLPIWALLQPRDYINSHQLLVGLFFLMIGLAIVRPELQAPALNLSPQGAPPIFPFLFITIACGAISGFHGLVSSNTTSKQLDRMSDAPAIAYGGMLGEGFLAVIATIAVAAGLDQWDLHYHHWNTSGINAIDNFVQGAVTFLRPYPISPGLAAAFVAVMVISFAATSMDTAARIQRHLVSDIGRAFNCALLQNRFWATLLAIAPAVPLLLAGPKIWGALWLLFGTTNQLIAGITLLIICVYLLKSHRPVKAFLLPMLFVLGTTTLSMGLNLKEWTVRYLQGDPAIHPITLIIGFLIALLELWVIVESVIIIRSIPKKSHP